MWEKVPYYRLPHCISVTIVMGYMGYKKLYIYKILVM